MFPDAGEDLLRCIRLDRVAVLGADIGDSGKRHDLSVGRDPDILVFHGIGKADAGYDAVFLCELKFGQRRVVSVLVDIRSARFLRPFRLAVQIKGGVRDPSEAGGDGRRQVQLALNAEEFLGVIKVFAEFFYCEISCVVRCPGSLRTGSACLLI